MPRYTGASASSNFPQTSKNRPLEALTKEIASYTGGKKRTETIIGEAQDSLFQAIREFNEVAWIFNRTSEDLTLASPVSGTDADYDLNRFFRDPIAALYVDANGKTRRELDYIDWRVWLQERPSQTATTSSSSSYTVRNIHLQGRLTIDPAPATANLTYPTLRAYYHTRIACPGAGESINVPEEVEEAIFQRAVALFLSKKKSFREADAATKRADLRRLFIERTHRDSSEISILQGII